MNARYVENLRALPLLEGALPTVLEGLARAVVEREYRPGDVIIKEGAASRDMYLILEGRLEVTKTRRGETAWLGERGPGDLLGEMAFVEEQPRFATVRALTRCRLLELPEAAMRASLAEQPELLFRAIRMLSARLRASDLQMIDDLRRKNEELARAYRELQAAQMALVEKERLEHELQLAHDIQCSILPEGCLQFATFNCSARYRAARQVGGDFYDVFALDRERVGLVMADVSGKGLAAAMFMALTRSLIRAEARHLDSPRETLLRVNQLLLEMSRASMFVTVFYGVLDVVRGTLYYARAGHDYPLLFHARTGQSSFLEGEGTVLGFMDQVMLEEACVELSPGDLFVLYTDGITEACSQAGEFFDTERLRAALDTQVAVDAQAVCDGIMAAVDSFQEGAEQHDDMALLVVKMEDRKQ